MTALWEALHQKAAGVPDVLIHDLTRFAQTNPSDFANLVPQITTYVAQHVGLNPEIVAQMAVAVHADSKRTTKSNEEFKSLDEAMQTVIYGE